MIRCLPLCGVLLLVACASPAPISEPVWYRLAEPTPLRVSQPLAEAISVHGFRAAGLHGEQSLVYSDEPAGLRLRQYNYHLWTHPPAQMLEHRLASMLRQAGAAPLVASRLPNRREGLRISATLLALERVNQGAHWQVRVAMAFEVEAADGSRLPHLVEYADQRIADGDGVERSVHAFSVAIDSVFERFVSDLEQWAAQ